MATDLATFFIRIHLLEDFKLQEDICLDNGKTNERLLTKTKVITDPDFDEKEVLLLISRYPRASTNKWIVANEKEVFNWDIGTCGRSIYLPEEMEVVASKGKYTNSRIIF
jgi:hypothetical protein